MPWPNATTYFEAIQNPGNCFADPELRQGEPTTNKMGLPILYSGNFAAVFQMRCPGNARWAVKCFTREVPGLQQRYHAISAALQKARLPFMVDFHYLPEGIRVGGQWYAVLKMRWVEGLALNQLVQNCLDQPKALNQLALMWIKLARELCRTGLAHGDLQHGNVLLVPGRRAARMDLRLIDYDGLFVPALAQSPPPERGHPNFQHPERQRDGAYNADIDRFSHLVIFTALQALSVAGRSLWRPEFDDGENVLFREDDFRNPAESALLRELWQIHDPTVQGLVGRLILASQGPLEQVPFLPDLVGKGGLRPLGADQLRTLNDVFPPSAQRPVPSRSSSSRLRTTVMAGKARWLVLGLASLAVAGAVFVTTTLPGKDHGSADPDPAESSPHATAGKPRLIFDPAETREGTILATLEGNGLPTLAGPWYHLGPFDQDYAGTPATIPPPLSESDRGKTYVGRGGQSVHWREFPKFRVGRFVDLAALFDQPTEHACVYLYHPVVVEQAICLPVSFGSDDTFVAWLNGKEIAARKTTGPIARDQERAVLELRLGRNDLLVKVCNDRKAWAFYIFPNFPAALEAEFGARLPVYLADLKETGVKVGAGQLGKNGDLGHSLGRIAVGGVPSLHGLSMHAVRAGQAHCFYSLGKAYRRLRTTVAINDTAGDGSLTALHFVILGDGKRLWKSRPLKKRGDTEDCTVSVEGVDTLELRVNCPGKNGRSHAVWLDPRLTRN